MSSKAYTRYTRHTLLTQGASTTTAELFTLTPIQYTVYSIQYTNTNANPANTTFKPTTYKLALYLGICKDKIVLYLGIFILDKA